MPEGYFLPFTSTLITNRLGLEGKFNGNQHDGLYAVAFSDGSMGVEKNLADWTGNKTGRHYPAELLAQQEYLSARVGEALDAPIRDCLLVSDTAVLMPFVAGSTGKDLERELPISPKSARLALFDYLVANADRRPKNIIYTDDGDFVGIDHALCNFRPRKPTPELISMLWNNGYTAESLEALRPALIGTQGEFERLDHLDKWLQMIENLDLLVEAFGKVAKAVVVKSSDLIARAKQAEQKALELRRNEKFESASYAHAEAGRLYTEAAHKNPDQATYLLGQAKSQKDLAHTASSAYTLGENHSPVEFNKSGLAKIAERLRRRSKEAEDKGDADTASRLYYEAMDAQFKADQEVSKGGAGSGRYPKGSGKTDLGSPDLDMPWEKISPLLDRVGNAIEGGEFDRDTPQPEGWETDAPILKTEVAESLAKRLDSKWTPKLAEFLDSEVSSALDDPNPNDLIFDFSSCVRQSNGEWNNVGIEYPEFVGYASEMGEERTNGLLEGGALRASDPRFGEGVRAMSVSALIHQWAETSNDHNAMALALQRATQEEFGLEGTKGWDIDADTQKKTDQYYEKYGDMFKAFVRAQYDETQDFFAKNGITQVPVYRGMYFADESDVPKWLNDFAESNDGSLPDIPTRPMAAYSYDESSAHEFAQGATANLYDIVDDGANDVSVVISGLVPASRVLSCAQTGVGCYHEREIVVLGGTDKWNIETGMETW